MRLYGTNLCINCTSSTRFAPSWQMQSNTTKTHQNMSLGSNGVDRVHSLPKIPMRVRGRNFCINCTSSAYSHRVSCNNETIQNAPKHYKTHQFMSLASMEWIGCVHCKKLWCDFVARTSSLIAPVQPVLHWVSCSNETNPKCAQTIRNEPIIEFRVQWGGSGAFVAKNSNAT